MTMSDARMWLLATVVALGSSTACKSGRSEPSFLLNVAQNTAPTIKGNVTQASLIRPGRLLDSLIRSAYAAPSFPQDCKATYGYMCLGWEFFTLLREFDPAINESLPLEDKVSSEDFYYQLDLAGRAYEAFSTDTAALGSAKAIAAPFDFGATDIAGETYDHAKNGASEVSGFPFHKADTGVALRDDGTTRHFLVAIGSNDDTDYTAGRSKLVMQGAYNQTSGDVELNFVLYNKYPASAGPLADQTIMMRSHIKGNQNTHYFEFEAGTTNTGSGPGCWNWGSVQGAGYSKGTGKHYLVFYRGTNAQADPNGVPGAGTTGGYYCVAADTTKASFGAAIYDKPAGYTFDTVPADCADFKTTVAVLPRWEITNTGFESGYTQTCMVPVEPVTADYPVKSDSPLYRGTGAQKLELAF